MGVDWSAAGLGAVVPRLPDAGAVTLAVGIVGATIMPHAIFLHSGLTQNRAPGRNDRERRLNLLVGYRYVPDHLHGLVALLLFFVALVLGAAVATDIHALFTLS